MVVAPEHEHRGTEIGRRSGCLSSTGERRSRWIAAEMQPVGGVAGVQGRAYLLSRANYFVS
jgi:hypothetical protein